MTNESDESSGNGFALLLTGLSGAGKSSIARHLVEYLQQEAKRRVTLLDGDEVRKHLCAGLGFSREDRMTNVQRLAYVASEVVKHEGIAVCAVIAPYAQSRIAMREMVQRYGRFYEVYVNTPIGVCESRDVKGLYAKARSGEIQLFTGITDPYEAPVQPDLEIDASVGSPLASAHQIVDFLMRISKDRQLLSRR
ncbi:MULTISPECIES: adenylyl-sulfate kinase [Pseudomonas]|uniref:adenylyl-sulfate kinase n=1 Tax=Pseudomonas TaxID=286 RepID=UPI0008115F61|nr:MULTISPECIES: adenylyl-sulfate kinase [Pseudomonas]MEE3633838.1 adenylyl-sulfate kinase [Pseudomonas sp. AL 58]